LVLVVQVVIFLASAVGAIILELLEVERRLVDWDTKTHMR
jgi:hypothetical protein